MNDIMGLATVAEIRSDPNKFFNQDELKVTPVLIHFVRRVFSEHIIKG
jgi:hypothetical protein